MFSPGKTQERLFSFRHYIDHGGISDSCIGNESTQMYSYDITSGALEQETVSALGVQNFEMTDRALIYLDRVGTQHFYEHISVPGELFPNEPGNFPTFADLIRDNPNRGKFATYVKLGAEDAPSIGEPFEGYFNFQRYFISPDGRWAVMVADISHEAKPLHWQGYVLSGAPNHWTQFQLVNLITGAATENVFEFLHEDTY